MIRVGREAFLSEFYSLGEAEKMHFRPLGLKVAFSVKVRARLTWLRPF
jgi:hypothetical protein